MAMSSLIGDPIWRVIHHIEGVIGGAIRHVGHGVVAMDAGDWAGWAQFGGAMLAIGFAWWQAGRDTRLRDRQDEQRQLVNYKIAEDMFRRITDQVHVAAKEVKRGRGIPYFRGNPVASMDETIKIISHLLVSPLPSRNAAIDVQMMHVISLDIREQLILAQRSANEAECRHHLYYLISLWTETKEYAYRERDKDGPKQKEDLKRYRRWRSGEPPDKTVFLVEIDELAQMGDEDELG